MKGLLLTQWFKQFNLAYPVVGGSGSYPAYPVVGGSGSYPAYLVVGGLGYRPNAAGAGL